MRVIIACGGSGGHIYPALSLASALKEKRKDIDILLIATRKPLDRKILGGKPYPFFALPVTGLPPLLSWRFPLFLVKFFYSFFVCLIRVAPMRPDLFVGFGGYVSGPVILTGLFLRKPTFIHEENLIPGRANLFLSRWASRIGVAFEETKNFFHLGAPVVCIGNPVRGDLVSISPMEARGRFGLEKDRFTLLVMGGSQGAHRLNQGVVKTLERMSEPDRSAIQVIHLAGEQDASWMEACYRMLKVSSRVYPYFEKMGEAYSAADLVVARGGAMTIAEVGYFRKCALFVPLATAQNHQMENVRHLAAQKACILFEEEKTMTDEFLRTLLELKRDGSRRRALSEKLAALCPTGSAERLAEEILSLTGKD